MMLLSPSISSLCLPFFFFKLCKLSFVKSECSCVQVPLCVCVCVCACAHVYVLRNRIVDKSLHFTNTFIIIIIIYNTVESSSWWILGWEPSDTLPAFCFTFIQPVYTCFYLQHRAMELVSDDFVCGQCQAKFNNLTEFLQHKVQRKYFHFRVVPQCLFSQ